MHRNHVIHDLVKAGIPAIEVTCAIEDDHNSKPKYMGLATRHSK